MKLLSRLRKIRTFGSKFRILEQEVRAVSVAVGLALSVFVAAIANALKQVVRSPNHSFKVFIVLSV